MLASASRAHRPPAGAPGPVGSAFISRPAGHYFGVAMRGRRSSPFLAAEKEMRTGSQFRSSTFMPKRPKVVAIFERTISLRLVFWLGDVKHHY